MTPVCSERHDPAGEGGTSPPGRPAVGLTAQRPRVDPSLSLFLGLYLLILAFFILLFSLSTIEEVKARAVLGSLSSTFGNEPAAGAAPAIRSGAGEAVRLIERDVMAALESLVRVAEVDVIKSGRLMRVALPAAVVFAPGAVSPRPSLYPMLDRIVATLSSPPAGLRVELEFAIAPDDGPETHPPPARRADAFAREMLARGAPPSRISIALAPRAADRAWLTFRVANDHSPGSGGPVAVP
jgi:hypothetical protein